MVIGITMGLIELQFSINPEVKCMNVIFRITTKTNELTKTKMTCDESFQAGYFRCQMLKAKFLS